MADTMPKQRVETHHCRVKGPKTTTLTLTLDRDRIYRGRCPWCHELFSGDATGALIGVGAYPEGPKD